MSAGKIGSGCGRCTPSMSYEDQCKKCFAAEVLDMTIKEMRVVGSELGVNFCGKTLKADLQTALVNFKVENKKVVVHTDSTCSCTSDTSYDGQCRTCFKENVLLMTIEEMRKVGKELHVKFESKTSKADLQKILIEYQAKPTRGSATLVNTTLGIDKDVLDISVGLQKVQLDLKHAKSNKKTPTEEKTIQQLLTQYKSVSSLGSAVAASRHDIDLYSKSAVSTLESPEVDHIVETQMMAHCATAALRARAMQFVPDLSHLINPTDMKNYNVCSKSVNISKGQVVRLFLNDTDGLHRDSGIRAKPYYHCYNQMGNITQAWIDTFPEIAEDVRTYRGRADYVQNGDFEQVATQIDDLFDRMKLLNVEGIVTRSKTKATKK